MAKRNPVDTFDTQVFHAFIAREIAKWQTIPEPFELKVGMARLDGTWDFGIMDTSAKLANPFMPAPDDYRPVVVAGTIWLEDHDGTPVVAWELSDGQRGIGRAPELQG